MDSLSVATGHLLDGRRRWPLLPGASMRDVRFRSYRSPVQYYRVIAMAGIGDRDGPEYAVRLRQVTKNQLHRAVAPVFDIFTMTANDPIYPQN
jgi:hypothetical protein